MEYDSIFDRFRILAELDNAEAENWSWLVYDAMVEIRNMLVPECDVEINCHRLTAVTAALAYYRYRRVAASRGEPSSFKAGDVTLNLDNGSVENAFRIYSELLEGMGDILKMNDFVFGGTESLCTKN